VKSIQHDTKIPNMIKYTWHAHFSVSNILGMHTFLYQIYLACTLFCIKCHR